MVAIIQIPSCSFPPQGRGGADRPGSSAAGSLHHIWGTVVAGCSPMGPGTAGLGGAEGAHVVETGLHAESRPHSGRAAPESGPQRQDADRTVSQSPAAGAGDGGHLQRIHPVSVLILCPPTYISPNHIMLMCIFCLVSNCHCLFQACSVNSLLCPVLVNLPPQVV